MRKAFLIWMLVGVILGVTFGAVADGYDVETLWNKMFDSTNNVIRVVGQ